MSQYEDYDKTSNNYDSQRIAMGANIIAALFQFKSGMPLSDMGILDAGCGTGNYAKALLDMGVGQVTLIDASSGMLQKARDKLPDANYAGRVKDVKQVFLPSLPFADSSFDGVMFNLVLHHLDGKHDGKSYPQIERTLREAKRVLKPNGVLVITTVTPSRLTPLLWYKQINKTLTKRHALLYPEVPQFTKIVETSGFQFPETIHLDFKMPEAMRRAQTDPEGPAKKEWRDCNSYWASATPDEIKEIEEWVMTMKEKCLLDTFVRDNDKTNGYYPLTIYISTVM